MKKKMVHGLRIPLAHTTYLDHNDMLFPKVVHGKDFLRAPGQVKQVAPKITFVCQILFQGKEMPIITKKNIVERSNIEQPSLGGSPSKLVFASLSHSN
jgi:hypothetical protein